LHEGAVCNGRLVCPWHSGTFRIADGALVEPPPMQGLTRYSTRVVDGQVLLDPAGLPESAPARRDPAERRTAVLIGDGAAAAMAATSLREFGFGGRLIMIGPNAEEPIDRTLLSKQALAGQSKLDELSLWDDTQRERLDVERVVAEVTALDPSAKRPECSDGTKLGYGVALVATGGRPRRLDLPGSHLRGVFTLRHRADVAAIRDGIGEGASAVVVGTSFIGMEAAGALTQKGLEVTAVGPEELPFAKQFGPELAGALRRLHERNGVQFRLGTSVTRIEGDDAVQAVVLRTGERLATPIVLTGIGVQPVTEFVANVSKAEDGGILVDLHLRAADGLYAAGDVAAFPGPDGKTLRIEHWRVAEQQGRVAARNMLGDDEPYTRVPFFWTAQHDVVVNYVGHAAGWDELVVDGDIDSFAFLAFYVKDGIVAAVATAGRDHEIALLSELMRERLTVTALKERLRR
jgi:NADPH-dependent 2,4-dienoyl-CoA reductase/sulfur reductase-like enzyme